MCILYAVLDVLQETRRWNTCNITRRKRKPSFFPFSFSRHSLPSDFVSSHQTIRLFSSVCVPRNLRNQQSQEQKQKKGEKRIERKRERERQEAIPTRNSFVSSCVKRGCLNSTAVSVLHFHYS